MASSINDHYSAYLDDLINQANAMIQSPGLLLQASQEEQEKKLSACIQEQQITTSQLSFTAGTPKQLQIKPANLNLNLNVDTSSSPLLSPIIPLYSSQNMTFQYPSHLPSQDYSHTTNNINTLTTSSNHEKNSGDCGLPMFDWTTFGQFESSGTPFQQATSNLPAPVTTLTEESRSSSSRSLHISQDTQSPLSLPPTNEFDELLHRFHDEQLFNDITNMQPISLTSPLLPQMESPQLTSPHFTFTEKFDFPSTFHKETPHNLYKLQGKESEGATMKLNEDDSSHHNYGASQAQSHQHMMYPQEMEAASPRTPPQMSHVHPKILRSACKDDLLSSDGESSTSISSNSRTTTPTQSPVQPKAAARKHTGLYQTTTTAAAAADAKNKARSAINKRCVANDGRVDHSKLERTRQIARRSYWRRRNAELQEQEVLRKRLNSLTNKTKALSEQKRALQEERAHLVQELNTQICL
eukprot:gene11260-3306_t